MPHHHHHTHDHTAPPVRALRLAFFLNLSFTVVEALGGWWTNSIAVLTDALHDLGDTVVLGAAWYLQGLAGRSRDERYSYGYGRYSMLGGWLAAAILVVGSVVMFILAATRLFAPVLPHAQGMMVLAVFGLVMNGIAAWQLHSGTTLNERGAYLHLLEDVLGWAAVLAGAVVIHISGWAIIDPLLSMAISAYIFTRALGTLRNGTRILMQARPIEVDTAGLREQLLRIPGVRSLHDQHTWTLDGSYVVHTVHMVLATDAMPRSLEIKAEAHRVLRNGGIDHTTIEVEPEQGTGSCTPDTSNTHHQHP